MTRRSFPASGVVALALLLVTPWAERAHAHEIRPAVATVAFETDGRFRAELVLNAEALLAGIGSEHRDTNDAPGAGEYNAMRALEPADLARLFRDLDGAGLAGVTLHFDDEAARPPLAAVAPEAVGDLALSRKTRLIYEGRMPAGVRSFAWQSATRLGNVAVRIRRAGESAPQTAWLTPGAISPRFDLSGLAPPPSRLAVARDYVALGFTHILPKGLDHILFVLGLFLLSSNWRPLLAQVTAFTVAHTLTLALSMYGVVSLPPAVVEPLIALSIVYVAIENVMTTVLKPWRVLLVFAFGLLHGLGFAGVLAEIGLPPSERITALLSFNAGVELGQLAVITLAFAMLGVWGRGRSWYRPYAVVPVSVLIAAIGLYWTVERISP